MPLSMTRKKFISFPFLLPVGLIGTALAIWLPILWWGHSASLEGTRYWWLADDAMISMRYARNLADGFGLVWNPGERVEGYTNLLWTLYMAAIHLLPLQDSHTALLVLLTCVGMGSAVIPVLMALGRDLRMNGWAVAAAACAFVFNRNLAAWITSGFETPGLLLFFIVAIRCVIRDAEAETPSWKTYVWIALVSLVRADAFVLSLLLCAMALVLNRRRKDTLLRTALVLGTILAQECFRLAYYGDILPNTAYLKVMNWSQRNAAGFDYLVEFGRQYGLLIFLALAGCLLSLRRTRIALGGLLLVYFGYIAAIGGDAFPNFRFFIPILPVIHLLAFDGIATLAQAFLKSGLPTEGSGLVDVKIPSGLLMALGLGTSALSLAADGLGFGGRSGMGLAQILGFTAGLLLIVSGLFLSAWKKRNSPSLPTPATIRGGLQILAGALCLFATPWVFFDFGNLIASADESANVRIGVYLGQHSPPNSKVADFWAGSVFYFSGRYGIDLLGKSDPYIAHSVEAAIGKPGHNKFDFNYSLGVLQPDYVVANFTVPADESAMRASLASDYPFNGELFFHPLFREHCLHHPIPLPWDSWRTVFRCYW